jgi:hypothetical protein
LGSKSLAVPATVSSVSNTTSASSGFGALPTSSGTGGHPSYFRSFY